MNDEKEVIHRPPQKKEPSEVNVSDRKINKIMKHSDDGYVLNTYRFKTSQDKFVKSSKEQSAYRGTERISIVITQKTNIPQKKQQVPTEVETIHRCRKSANGPCGITPGEYIKIMAKDCSTPDVRKGYVNRKQKKKISCSDTYINKSTPFITNLIVNTVTLDPHTIPPNFQELLKHPLMQAQLRIYRCQLDSDEEKYCQACNSDAFFEVLKGLYDCYIKKNCENCNCILCSSFHKARRKLLLGEASRPKVSVGVETVATKRKVKETFKRTKEYGLFTSSVAKPTEQIETKITASSKEPLSTQIKKLRKAQASGILPTLEGYKPIQREKTSNALVQSGSPLNGRKNTPDNKVINQVRKELGLPLESRPMLENGRDAKVPGHIASFEKKTQKETILRAEAEKRSIVSRETRPTLELKRKPIETRAQLEKKLKVRGAGLLTPNETPEQKEMTPPSIEQHGICLAEGKTISERKLIDKIRKELCLTTPITKTALERITKPILSRGHLLGYSPLTTEKKRNLCDKTPKAIKNGNLRICSLLTLQSNKKTESKTVSPCRLTLETVKAAETAGLFSQLQGKTQSEKEKVIRSLANQEIPFPDAKTPSEKKIAKKIRAQLGLPPAPATRSTQTIKYEKVKAQSLIAHAERKTTAQKKKNRGSIEASEQNTPSTKEISRKVKSASVMLTLKGETPEQRALLLRKLKALDPKSTEERTPSEKTLMQRMTISKSKGLVITPERKNQYNKVKMLRRIAKSGLPLPEGRTASDKELIKKIRTEMVLPLETITPSIKEKLSEAQATSNRVITPFENKLSIQAENVLNKISEPRIQLVQCSPPNKNSNSEKSTVRGFRTMKTGTGHVRKTKGVVTQSVAVIKKELGEKDNTRDTCEMGCGCDKKKIRFKHSYVKIRVTSPDTSSLCSCPHDCPCISSGAFTENEGIKVTVETATGLPSYKVQPTTPIKQTLLQYPVSKQSQESSDDLFYSQSHISLEISSVDSDYTTDYSSSTSIVYIYNSESDVSISEIKRLLRESINSGDFDESVQDYGQTDKPVSFIYQSRFAISRADIQHNRNQTAQERRPVSNSSSGSFYTIETVSSSGVTDSNYIRETFSLLFTLARTLALSTDSFYLQRSVNEEYHDTEHSESLVKETDLVPVDTLLRNSRYLIDSSQESNEQYKFEEDVAIYRQTLQPFRSKSLKLLGGLRALRAKKDFVSSTVLTGSSSICIMVSTSGIDQHNSGQYLETLSKSQSSQNILSKARAWMDTKKMKLSRFDIFNRKRSCLKKNKQKCSNEGHILKKNCNVSSKADHHTALKCQSPAAKMKDQRPSRALSMDTARDSLRYCTTDEGSKAEQIKPNVISEIIKPMIAREEVAQGLLKEAYVKMDYNQTPSSTYYPSDSVGTTGGYVSPAERSGHSMKPARITRRDYNYLYNQDLDDSVNATEWNNRVQYSTEQEMLTPNSEISLVSTVYSRGCVNPALYTAQPRQTKKCSDDCKSKKSVNKSKSCVCTNSLNPGLSSSALKATTLVFKKHCPNKSAESSLVKKVYSHASVNSLCSTIINARDSMVYTKKKKHHHSGKKSSLKRGHYVKDVKSSYTQKGDSNESAESGHMKKSFSHDSVKYLCASKGSSSESRYAERHPSRHSPKPYGKYSSDDTPASRYAKKSHSHDSSHHHCKKQSSPYDIVKSRYPKKSSHYDSMESGHPKTYSYYDTMGSRHRQRSGGRRSSIGSMESRHTQKSSPCGSYESRYSRKSSPDASVKSGHSRKCCSHHRHARELSYGNKQSFNDDSDFRVTKRCYSQDSLNYNLANKNSPYDSLTPANAKKSYSHDGAEFRKAKKYSDDNVKSHCTKKDCAKHRHLKKYSPYGSVQALSVPSYNEKCCTRGGAQSGHVKKHSFYDSAGPSFDEKCCARGSAHANKHTYHDNVQPSYDEKCCTRGNAESRKAKKHSPYDNVQTSHKETYSTKRFSPNNSVKSGDSKKCCSHKGATMQKMDHSRCTKQHSVTKQHSRNYKLKSSHARRPSQSSVQSKSSAERCHTCDDPHQTLESCYTKGCAHHGGEDSGYPRKYYPNDSMKSGKAKSRSHDNVAPCYPKKCSHYDNAEPGHPKICLPYDNFDPCLPKKCPHHDKVEPCYPEQIFCHNTDENYQCYPKRCSHHNEGKPCCQKTCSHQEHGKLCCQQQQSNSLKTSSHHDTLKAIFKKKGSDQEIRPPCYPKRCSHHNEGKPCCQKTCSHQERGKPCCQQQQSNSLKTSSYHDTLKAIFKKKGSDQEIRPPCYPNRCSHHDEGKPCCQKTCSHQERGKPCCQQQQSNSLKTSSHHDTLKAFLKKKGSDQEIRPPCCQKKSSSNDYVEPSKKKKPDRKASVECCHQKKSDHKASVECCQRKNSDHKASVECCQRKKSDQKASVECCQKKKLDNKASVECCQRKISDHKASVECCQRKKLDNKSSVECCQRKKSEHKASVECCQRKKSDHKASVECYQRKKLDNKASVECCQRKKSDHKASVESCQRKKPARSSSVDSCFPKKCISRESFDTSTTKRCCRRNSEDSTDSSDSRMEDSMEPCVPKTCLQKKKSKERRQSKEAPESCSCPKKSPKSTKPRKNVFQRLMASMGGTSSKENNDTTCPKRTPCSSYKSTRRHSVTSHRDSMTSTHSLNSCRRTRRECGDTERQTEKEYLEMSPQCKRPVCPGIEKESTPRVDQSLSPIKIEIEEKKEPKKIEKEAEKIEKKETEKTVEKKSEKMEEKSEKIEKKKTEKIEKKDSGKVKKKESKQKEKKEKKQKEPKVKKEEKLECECPITNTVATAKANHEVVDDVDTCCTSKRHEPSRSCRRDTIDKSCLTKEQDAMLQVLKRVSEYLKATGSLGDCRCDNKAKEAYDTETCRRKEPCVAKKCYPCSPLPKEKDREEYYEHGSRRTSGEPKRRRTTTRERGDVDACRRPSCVDRKSKRHSPDAKHSPRSGDRDQSPCARRHTDCKSYLNKRRTKNENEVVTKVTDLTKKTSPCLCNSALFEKMLNKVMKDACFPPPSPPCGEPQSQNPSNEPSKPVKESMLPDKENPKPVQEPSASQATQESSHPPVKTSPAFTPEERPIGKVEKSPDLVPQKSSPKSSPVNPDVVPQQLPNVVVGHSSVLMSFAVLKRDSYHSDRQKSNPVLGPVPMQVSRSNGSFSADISQNSPNPAPEPTAGLITLRNPNVFLESGAGQIPQQNLNVPTEPSDGTFTQRKHNVALETSLVHVPQQLPNTSLASQRLTNTAQQTRIAHVYQHFPNNLSYHHFGAFSRHPNRTQIPPDGAQEHQSRPNRCEQFENISQTYSIYSPNSEFRVRRNLTNCVVCNGEQRKQKHDDFINTYSCSACEPVVAYNNSTSFRPRKRNNIQSDNASEVVSCSACNPNVRNANSPCVNNTCSWNNMQSDNTGRLSQNSPMSQSYSRRCSCKYIQFDNAGPNGPCQNPPSIPNVSNTVDNICSCKPPASDNKRRKCATGYVRSAPSEPNYNIPRQSCPGGSRQRSVVPQNLKVNKNLDNACKCEPPGNTDRNNNILTPKKNSPREPSMRKSSGNSSTACKCDLLDNNVRSGISFHPENCLTERPRRCSPCNPNDKSTGTAHFPKLSQIAKSLPRTASGTVICADRKLRDNLINPCVCGIDACNCYLPDYPLRRNPINSRCYQKNQQGQTCGARAPVGTCLQREPKQCPLNPLCAQPQKAGPKSTSFQRPQESTVGPGGQYDEGVPYQTIGPNNQTLGPERQNLIPSQQGGNLIPHKHTQGGGELSQNRRQSMADPRGKLDKGQVGDLNYQTIGPQGQMGEPNYPTLGPQGQMGQNNYPKMAPQGHVGDPNYPTMGPQGQVGEPNYPTLGPQGQTGEPNYPTLGPHEQMGQPNYPTLGPQGQLGGPNYPTLGPQRQVGETNYPTLGPQGQMGEPNYPTLGPQGQMGGPNYPTLGPQGQMDDTNYPLTGPQGQMKELNYPTMGPQGQIEDPNYPTMVNQGQKKTNYDMVDTQGQNLGMQQGMAGLKEKPEVPKAGSDGMGYEGRQIEMHAPNEGISQTSSKQQQMVNRYYEMDPAFRGPMRMPYDHMLNSQEHIIRLHQQMASPGQMTTNRPVPQNQFIDFLQRQTPFPQQHNIRGPSGQVIQNYEGPLRSGTLNRKNESFNLMAGAQRQQLSPRQQVMHPQGQIVQNVTKAKPENKLIEKIRKFVKEDKKLSKTTKEARQEIEKVTKNREGLLTRRASQQFVGNINPPQEQEIECTCQTQRSCFNQKVWENVSEPCPCGPGSEPLVVIEKPEKIKCGDVMLQIKSFFKSTMKMIEDRKQNSEKVVLDSKKKENKKEKKKEKKMERKLMEMKKKSKKKRKDEKKTKENEKEISDTESTGPTVQIIYGPQGHMLGGYPDQMSEGYADHMPGGYVDHMAESYPDHLTVGYPNQMAGGYANHMEGGYVDHMAAGYPNYMEGGYPDQMAGGYPDQMEGSYPEQMERAYPDQMERGYPNQMEGSYRDQMEGGYPDLMEEGYPDQIESHGPMGRRYYSLNPLDAIIYGPESKMIESSVGTMTKVSQDQLRSRYDLQLDPQDQTGSLQWPSRNGSQGQVMYHTTGQIADYPSGQNSYYRWLGSQEQMDFQRSYSGGRVMSAGRVSRGCDEEMARKSHAQSRCSSYEQKACPRHQLPFYPYDEAARYPEHHDIDDNFSNDISASCSCRPTEDAQMPCQSTHYYQYLAGPMATGPQTRYRKSSRDHILYGNRGDIESWQRLNDHYVKKRGSSQEKIDSHIYPQEAGHQVPDSANTYDIHPIMSGHLTLMPKESVAQPIGPRAISPRVYPAQPTGLSAPPPRVSQAQPMGARAPSPRVSQAQPIGPKALSPRVSQAQPNGPRAPSPRVSQAQPMGPRAPSLRVSRSQPTGTSAPPPRVSQVQPAFPRAPLPRGSQAQPMGPRAPSTRGSQVQPVGLTAPPPRVSQVQPADPRAPLPRVSQAQPMGPRAPSPRGSQVQPMSQSAPPPRASQAQPMGPRAPSPGGSQLQPMGAETPDRIQPVSSATPSPKTHAATLTDVYQRDKKQTESEALKTLLIKAAKRGGCSKEMCCSWHDLQKACLKELRAMKSDLARTTSGFQISKPKRPLVFCTSDSSFSDSSKNVSEHSEYNLECSRVKPKQEIEPTPTSLKDKFKAGLFKKAGFLKKMGKDKKSDKSDVSDQSAKSEKPAKSDKSNKTSDKPQETHSESDNVPEADLIVVEDDTFKGFKFSLGGKGKDSPGLSGIFCFNMTQQL